MPEPDLIELFVRPLSDLTVRYLVCGSVAAMLYGEPRVTHDVDLIVFLRIDEIPRVTAAFSSADFYVPPGTVIQTEIARERYGHFNLIHLATGLKADIYTAGRDPFHAWAFRNARRYEVRGLVVNLAPMEYVIVRKLEYYREGGSEKHMRDIQSMLRVSGSVIDSAAMDEWTRARNVATEWARVQDFLA